MRFIVNGACGRMGQEVIKQLSDDELAARVDAFSEEDGVIRDINEFNGKADGIIDFSSHLGSAALCIYASEHKIPLVIASTGHTDEEKNKITETAEKIPVFFSYNMSVGIAALCEMVKKAAAIFPESDIEIVETHHKMKKDAPSGTAIMLAGAVLSVRDGKIVCGREGESLRTDNEIGIHSLRLANVVGKHEVIISNGLETLTLTHEAHSRTLFAQGAVRAAKFIAGKPAGLYNMQQLLNGDC
ncbi:MAG: 4-hydroxy-tetrahydrodipicolinate reductase [Clostridia bacterium]|nr:4-hydroxy-tetrahydrodipicolinate reductase [Clostridia bacterium]